METRVHDFWFLGTEAPPATSIGSGPWTKADTSAAGAPTVAATGGLMVLTLAATDEAENLCLYFGDALPFDIDDLIRAEFWAKVSTTPDANTMLAIGLASARNDTIDSLTAHASFRCIGNGAIVVESDDGTNDNDDKATGITLATTIKRFCIDFTSPHTQSPPSASLGGKGNVHFSIDDGYGNLQRVAATTRFDMSNYTAGLQPYVQLQKASGTGVPALSIKRVRITEKFGY